MSFTDSGNGYQLPYDSSSEELRIAFMVRRMVDKLDTMKLVKVTNVRTGGGGAVAGTGTVDVQLLVSQLDGATPPNPTPRGIVTNIPWSRVAGGKNAIICDPAVGDIGFVVAADRDISLVKKTFGQSNPGSRRKFSISDGIYVSMALNVTPTQYLVFTSSGIRIVDANGNVVNMTSSGIAITPAGGTFTVNGKIMATGDIIAGTISLQNHLTTGVQSGTDLSGPPTG